MSGFSSLLSYFIEKKQIKVYDLIQYCSLDRSTMYKIIHGTRKPSSEALFHKIAEFLSLTPVEYEKFYQAYLIDKIGRETYYKRKCTEKHLMNFPNTFSREPVLFVENPEDFLEITSDACSPDALIHGQTGHTPPAQISRLSGCTVLSSRMELHHVLYEMFFQEASRQNGKIALLIQPDFDFLFSLLSSLKPKYSLKVEHTFCLSKTNQMSASHELYNLDYLSRILPLYFSSVDYHPYYFYEDIFAHSYSFNGISCIILTSQYAVTCTSDYKMGIFYTEPAVISMLWNLYDSYQNKCRPFAYVMDYLSGNSTTTFSENFYSESSNYILQPESCLVPFLNHKLLDAALIPDFPDRDSAIQQMEIALRENRQKIKNGNIYVYFTKKGFADFVATGRIREIPDSFYRPFTVEERIWLLRQIVPYCRQSFYRLLKKPLNQLSENLHLCVNGSSGYLLFNNIHNRTICLVLNESSILTTFWDYLQNLDERQLYSGEETAAFIERLISQLKTGSF